MSNSLNWPSGPVGHANKAGAQQEPNGKGMATRLHMMADPLGAIANAPPNRYRMANPQSNRNGMATAHNGVANVHRVWESFRNWRDWIGNSVVSAARAALAANPNVSGNVVVPAGAA